jgi:hypothetical protein
VPTDVIDTAGSSAERMLLQHAYAPVRGSDAVAFGKLRLYCNVTVVMVRRPARYSFTRRGQCLNRY